MLVGGGVGEADGFFVGDTVASGLTVLVGLGEPVGSADSIGSADSVGSADSSSNDGDGAGEALGSIDSGLSVGSSVGAFVTGTDGSRVSTEGDDRSPSSRPNAPAATTPVPATRPATSSTIAIACARIASGRPG